MATRRPAPEPAASPTIVDLEARLEVLEAENAELRARLAPPRARWRSVVASILIVLAALLTPVAIVSGWARVLLSDTNAFVATYAPVIRDPQVQSYLTDEVTAAIESKFDIDATVGAVIDGLAENAQRPQVRAALELLRKPAADGIRSTIRTATSRLIASDQFAQVWQESLQVSHAQATAALSGDPTSTLTINGNDLGIRLGPLVDRVRQSLVDQGFTFASAIPSVDRTVVIASADSVGQAQLAYRLVLATGYWLGFVVLALFVGGVLVAVRRWTAALWAAVGLGLGAVVVLAGLGIGRIVAEASVPASVMPREVLVLFYDTAGGAISDLARATLLVALVTAVGLWLGGPFRSSATVRGAWSSLTAGVRRWADGRGLSTGAVGEWLCAQRVVVRVVVGLSVVLVLALNRPLSVGLVAGTALVAVVVLLVLSLLERPAAVE